MSLALILLAYPLFYVGGISPDSRLHLLAFAPALLACAITIRFC